MDDTRHQALTRAVTEAYAFGQVNADASLLAGLVARVVADLHYTVGPGPYFALCPACGTGEVMRLPDTWRDGHAIPVVGCGNPWHYATASLGDTRPAWVVPDGYQPDGVGACSTCHAHVLWVHTRNGKRMPLDPDGTSHFATCPQADMHRRTRPHPLASLAPTDHTVEDHS